MPLPLDFTAGATIDPNIAAAEKRWLDLRDAGDPAAAEAEQEFQRLVHAQNDRLASKAYNNLISRMLK